MFSRILWNIVFEYHQIDDVWAKLSSVKQRLRCEGYDLHTRGGSHIGLAAMRPSRASGSPKLRHKQSASYNPPKREMIPFDASGAFHPLAEGSELRRLAVRGAAATLSASALSLAPQVVPTVVLARLLTPADFGVVTMVTTFSMLLMSFGTNGFSEAVIQREEMNRFQASNLFWINCAIGLILTIGFAAAGSLLARFYRNPLVAPVAVAMSVVIFIPQPPHTLSSSQTSHAIHCCFRQRPRRPRCIQRRSDPAGFERLGILGAGGGNRRTGAQHYDWGLVALPMDSKPATAGSGNAGYIKIRR